MCHLRWGHARQPQFHTLLGNTENYDNKIPNINSYFDGVFTTSNHYLLHRRRRAVSLISLCAECCNRRRLRRHSLTRTRPLRISSQNFMICTSKQVLNFRRILNFQLCVFFFNYRRHRTHAFLSFFYIVIYCVCPNQRVYNHLTYTRVA